jgi:hypothetical protein
MTNQWDNFTIPELQAQLAALWPKYELVVHWRVTTQGDEFEVRWRPEGNLGLLSDFPVEVTADTLQGALAETRDRALEWIARIREAVETERNGVAYVKEDRLA